MRRQGIPVQEVQSKVGQGVWQSMREAYDFSDRELAFLLLSTGRGESVVERGSEVRPVAQKGLGC